MSEIMNGPRFLCKPRFKGMERFLRKVAFNLGNSPSQSEVKIISCIPIDVTDLQAKIATLEKKLAKYRRRSKGDRGAGGSGSSSSGQGVQPKCVMELQRKIETLEKQLLEYGALQRVCPQYPQAVPYPVYPPAAPYPAYPQAAPYPAYPPGSPFSCPAQTVPCPAHLQATPHPEPKRPTTNMGVGRSTPYTRGKPAAHLTNREVKHLSANTGCRHRHNHSVNMEDEKPAPNPQSSCARFAPKTDAGQPKTNTETGQPKANTEAGQPKTNTGAEQPAPNTKSGHNRNHPTTTEVKHFTTVKKAWRHKPHSNKMEGEPSARTDQEAERRIVRTEMVQRDGFRCSHCTEGGQERHIVRTETGQRDGLGCSHCTEAGQLNTDDAEHPAPNTESGKHESHPTTTEVKRLTIIKKGGRHRSHSNNIEEEPTSNKEAGLPTSPTTEQPNTNTVSGQPNATDIKSGQPNINTDSGQPEILKKGSCPGINVTCSSRQRAETNPEHMQPMTNAEPGQGIPPTSTVVKHFKTDVQPKQNQSYRTSIESGQHLTNSKARRYQSHPKHMEDGWQSKLKPLITSNSHSMPRCIKCNKCLCYKCPRPTKAHKKTLDHFISYHAQPYSSFGKCSKKLSRSLRKASPCHVSSPHVEEVSPKQYKLDPNRLMAILSASSNFSTPVCRDEDSVILDSHRKVAEVYSHMASQAVDRSDYAGYIDVDRRPELLCDGFFDVDRHKFSVGSEPSVDVILAHCSYNQPSSWNQSAYYDDSLYDLVPVRDTELKPKGNTSRNTKERKHNYYSQQSVKEERKPKKVPFKSVRRVLRHTPASKISRHESEAGIIDFNYIISNPYLKNRSRKIKHNTLPKKRVDQKEAECLTTDLANMEHQTKASKSIQLEPGLPAHGRTEDTLQQIKGILQSVLTEVKQGVPHCSPPQDTCDAEVHKSGLVGPEAPPSPPQPSHPCKANERLQTYPLFVHTTGHQWGCLMPTIPSSASSLCSQNTATNNAAPTNQRSEATEKLIKEIYKSIAVNMQRPQSDGDNASEGTDCSAAQLPCVRPAVSIVICGAGSVRSTNRTSSSNCEPPRDEPLKECRQLETPPDCENLPLHRTNKSRRKNIDQAIAELDSDATTTESRPKKKNGLLSKFRGLFKSKSKGRVSKEMQISESDASSACNEPLPVCSQRRRSRPHAPPPPRHRHAHSKVKLLSRSQQDAGLLHDGDSHSHRHTDRSPSPYGTHQPQPRACHH